MLLGRRQAGSGRRLQILDKNTRLNVYVGLSTLHWPGAQLIRAEAEWP